MDVVFIHIPKCAGTSISSASKTRDGVNVYGGKNKDRYIDGHYPFGVHNTDGIKESFGFSDSSAISCFTFLRHPISRWISQYRHVAWRSGGAMKTLMKKCLNDTSSKNIAYFLDQCIENNVNSNTMVKQLSGFELKKNKDNNYHIYKPQLCNGAMICDENMLEAAKSNLVNGFDVVGFVENFSEDFKKLCSFYNWDSVEAPEKNIHAKFKKKKDQRRARWGSVDFSSAEPKLVELNKFDLELYKFARSKFLECNYEL